MSNNKQSSVEWLLDNLHLQHSTKWTEIVEQAKAMHKKEIVKGVDFGINQWGGWDSLNGEQYYNETYGGDK